MDDDEQSGFADTFGADTLGIPVYITYVVLIFRLASTVCIIGMGSLVISTIAKNRSLHNIHNTFIVNLMVSDILGIATYTFQTTGMMFSYIIGIQDPFRCDVLNFSLFPIFVAVCTFVMLSVDKFIAIKFALRYKAIVTHHRVYQAIAAGWITALIFRFTRLIYELIFDAEYSRSSQLGFCSIDQYWVNLLTTIIPTFFACSVIITLDVYLSVKAYQLYKNSQGNNGEGLQTHVEDNNKTLQQLKPIITLLVTVSGNIAVAVIGSIVYVSTLIVENRSYQMFAKYIILPNLLHLAMILHPLVYGLYFKQICQPLCRRFKRMTQCCKCKKKLNSLVPSQPLCRRLKCMAQYCKCKKKLNSILPSQACNGQPIQIA